MEASQRAIEQQDRPAPEAIPGLGPSAYADELRGLVDFAFCFSDKYSEQQGRADRTGADPGLLEFERKLVKRAYKLGIPLFAHSVVRYADEQNRLYVKGVTKARAGDSPHNFGCAVDLIHGTKGWSLTEKQWEIIGHLGEELAKSLTLDVTWGGRWRFYDPAHWELTSWKEVRAKLSDYQP